MPEQGVIEKIRERLEEIQASFGVRKLRVFGSIARGEQRLDSDVDVLVEFDGPASFDSYMDLKFYLEDLLGRKVDLVTPKALRPPLRAAIESEALDVA